MSILLLHGWGVRRSIWDEAGWSLGTSYKVLSPCLYETAREAQDIRFDSIADKLKDVIEPDTIVIAWSIGGLIAVSLQKLTNKVKAIIFIASTPCFVNKENWLNVIDEKNIYGLQSSLKEDTNKTLEYFSGLIAHGDASAKETNKIIRKHLAIEEDKKILSTWLDQMITTDIRKSFSEITCPMLAILGENDSLINANIAQDIKLLSQDIETQIIKDCGHAPFLSKHQQTSTLINEFINAKLS